MEWIEALQKAITYMEEHLLRAVDPGQEEIKGLQPVYNIK